MNPKSKLCDAADWFRVDIEEIITDELKEVPRFHRKQWEFAMILKTLRDTGNLTPQRSGLSMGGGKELVAYAIARHVRQLTISDLYETGTDWDCARTENPDEFIKQNKPFPVDDARLKAVRMDMRELEFPDGTFDFCYSTCAIEHIGGREDFLRHFNEVARVLKDDGVYVFTTEMLYGNETIEDEHNVVFSPRYLADVLAESDLATEESFDARIAHHKINHPVPSTLSELSYYDDENLSRKIMEEAPHIQLLRGEHPFTCALFVVRKKKQGDNSRPIVFDGLPETKAFIDEGVNNYRLLLQSSRVSVNPFSLLHGGASRFCSDHREFFTEDLRKGEDESPFHTEYFWWGTGRRVFEVLFRVDGLDRSGEPEVELRIHRYKTLASGNVDCVANMSFSVPRVGWLVKRIEVQTDDAYCYAILAKVRNGKCLFDKIEVKSYPASLSQMTLTEPGVSPKSKQLLTV